MRVLLISHYFPPADRRASDSVERDGAACWAEAGDEVTVLTGFPNHPTGVVPLEYRGRIRAEDDTGDYRVVRTWVYATPNERVLKKTLSHLSFMLSSVFLGYRKTGRADVVIVSSPTFFSIWSAWLLARMKRARLIIEVRDLWPAIFVELGILTNRWIIAGLERFELAAYRAADVVVVVSEGFREHITARGIPFDKIEVIPNAADIARFEHCRVRSVTRLRLGVKPRETLVLYSGAHGLSHGLTAVADAAAKVTHFPVHFAFVGEGAAKADLARHVAQLGLNNVTMLPGVASAEMPEVIAAADICLVPLRDIALFKTFIPSKMFEYMAAGKAIIGAVAGEAAGILSDAGAIVVAPEDVDAIAAAVGDLAEDADRRNEIGSTRPAVCPAALRPAGPR